MGRLDGFSSLGKASLSGLEKIKADSVESTVATLGTTTLEGNVTQTVGAAVLKALSVDSATVSGNITQSGGTTATLKALTADTVTSSTELKCTAANGLGLYTGATKNVSLTYDGSHTYQTFAGNFYLRSGNVTRFIVGYDGSQISMGNSAVKICHGSGSPEGVITANVGSIYFRTDGGAGTSLYFKETGTGNTGWVSRSTFSSAITGYSGADISPAQGQLGDTYTLNTTTARTLNTGQQSIMSFTFDRGVGVWQLTGHYRIFVADGTNTCGITTVLGAGSLTHFYSAVIPENNSGASLNHTIPFSCVIKVTSLSTFSVTISAVLQAALVTGSIQTSSASDARYSAIQIVRIA